MAVLAVAAGVLGRLVWGRELRQRSRPVALIAALVAGVVLELLASRLLSGTTSVVAAVTGYSLLCAFALANRLHPGMLLVTAGLLANATVLLANNGMPVSGMPINSTSGDHHGLRPGGHMTALADVIPFLSERMSPGDVVLSLGGAVAVFTWIPAGRQRRVA